MDMLLYAILNKKIKNSGSGGGSIDLSEYAKKEDLVGQKTADGGEIFNDYENNIATTNSHAEGTYTTASGNYSHAEGGGTTASGYYSHAEGGGTTASGTSSHAEGGETKALGDKSHAEGATTTASGNYSHAEGYSTKANGNYSHAEGGGTTASGTSSHAEGSGTKASSNYQHVQGKFNVEDTNGKYAFIIGNGENNNNRSNAIAIDWDGLFYLNNSDAGIDLSEISGNVTKLINDSSRIEQSLSDYADTKEEVTQARVDANGTTYSTLKERLDSTDENVEKIESVSTELKGNLDDIDSVVYKVVKSENVYNSESEWFVGYALMGLIGESTMDTTYEYASQTISDVMEVIPGVTYRTLVEGGTTSTLGRWFLYGDDKVLINTEVSSTIEVPENGKYLRMQVNNGKETELAGIQPTNGTSVGYTIVPYSIEKLRNVALKDEIPDVSDIKNESKTENGKVWTATENGAEWKSIENETIKPIILFVFDNATYDNRAEILESNGMHGSFGLNMHSKSSTWYDDLKQLVKNGHDVGIYSGEGEMPTEYSGDTSEEDWYTYVKAAVDSFNAKGIYYPTMYHCPNKKSSFKLENALNDLNFRYVHCGYTMAGESWKDDGTVYHSISQNDGISKYISSYGMSQNDSATDIAKIDEAVENNYILPLFTHNVTENATGTQMELSSFKTVVAYVKSLKDAGTVEVLTLRELWEKKHPDEIEEMHFKQLIAPLVDLASSN